MRYIILVMLLSTSVFASPNRLSILAGHGAQPGFTGTTNQFSGKLTSGFKTGPVYGAQYQREIGGNLSIGIQGQTNDTVSVLLGVDF